MFDESSGQCDLQIFLEVAAGVRITHQVDFQVHDFAALVGRGLEKEEIAFDLDT